MRKDSICWPGMEPEKTFDQKMKEGSKTMDGIAESMPLQGEYEKPWGKSIHKPTRCDHD